MIDAEISRLMVDMFNKMTKKQNMAISREDALKIGDFLVQNGYRIVFGKWHLQQEPNASAQA